jgi:hypothetical protein
VEGRNYVLLGRWVGKKEWGGRTFYRREFPTEVMLGNIAGLRVPVYAVDRYLTLPSSIGTLPCLTLPPIREYRTPDPH